MKSAINIDSATPVASVLQTCHNSDIPARASQALVVSFLFCSIVTHWVKISLFSPFGLTILQHLRRSALPGIVAIAGQRTPCSYSKLVNCRI